MSRLLAALLILFFIFPNSYSINLAAVDYLSIKGDLQYDYYSHRLGDDWSSSKVSNGLNYNYAHNASSHTTDSWQSVTGETLNLDVGFKPNKYFNSEFGFEFIRNYADKYWMPVNLEHRMKLDNETFNWNKADITYNKDWLYLNYFRGIGHYHWGDKGDLFNLFPEQFEADKYLRLSGRSVPEGYQAVVRGKDSKLEVIYGPEVLWNYKQGYYLNYSQKLFGLDNHFIYTDNKIPYGETDERMRSFEMSTTYDFIQAGVLYRPFRLNRDYAYTEEVQNGNGLLGTNFLKKTGTTNSSDALGVSTKFSLLPEFIFDDINVQYSYLGLVAGNKQEISTQFNRRLSDKLSGTIGYKYRKPLLGPIPLIYQGILPNNGPALFEPRGSDSPFWVNWDNREASILSFTMTYDPTPNTPFYYYQPNILDEWNLNKKENAPLSFALNYTLTRYPSTTDRMFYYDDQGNLIWEPFGVTGAWATDGYIGACKFIAKVIKRRWQYIYDLGFGDSLATSSLAYTASDAKAKSITNYLTTGLTCRSYDYTIKLRYGQNVWGPEQWQQDFGESIDELYQAGISRKFGENITVGIDYTGVRELDYKYLAPELGDYDEVKCFVNIAFGPVIAYFGSEEEKPVIPVKTEAVKETPKPPVPIKAVPLPPPPPLSPAVVPPVPVKISVDAAKDIMKDIKEVKITEDARGLVMTSTVLFDFNESVLKPQGEKAVAMMVEVIKLYPKNGISVEGYTDSLGRDSYNQKLSKARAQSVANSLINAGVDAQRMAISGFGSKKPVASNATEKGREANRRVEVIIQK
jgi:outer membrane protein OmpA-like peptidoglycan-associated protein